MALDELSFSVPAGRMFGFVGPNGAGKTTAMRIVLGVLAPDAGEVHWQGRALDEQGRRGIGYMPEERGLYPKMPVGEQLGYLAQLHGMPAVRARDAAARWLERLGIADRTDDPVEALSLGNQQRVQLAAALVHEPPLLVLDEPFSGLDPVGVDVLSEVLLDEVRRRGATIVFSSHQLELVERLCDAVAIIAAGRLVASGGVDELRRAHGSRRWRVQVSGAPAAWHGGVDGVRALEDSIYELGDQADPQALLDAARRQGRVERFGPAEVTLAELFREATAAR